MCVCVCLTYFHSFLPHVMLLAPLLVFLHSEGEDSGARCLGVFWIAVCSRNELTAEMTWGFSKNFLDLDDRETTRNS